MPLREDILAPIPGDNPSGQNLAYAPVYDKIKDARREDEDWVQGQKKVADWPLVIKLAAEAIATKSKDLQLAAWLTEALIRKEGYGGLRAGLDLAKGLVANFWDTLYPEDEDGDLELRSAKIENLEGLAAVAIKEVPVVKAGYDYHRYKQAQTVGHEEDVDNPDKAKKRQEAIDEGKLTGEEFDKAFAETSKEFYKNAVADLEASGELLEELTALCEEKFGDYRPSFSRLRGALEEVRLSVNGLYMQKGGPDAVAAAPVEEEPAEQPEPVAVSTSGAATAAVRARTPVKKAVMGLEPADKEDAAARLAAIAKWMRANDGYDPAPYLMLRGFRWGELRASGLPPNETLFEAPAGETRQALKKAMLDGESVQVIELAEAAMAEPCGRAWLDLQRYVVTALENYGYPYIAEAIVAEVRCLINEIPSLRRATLMDDTPTANAETQAWLDKILAAGPAGEAKPQTHAMEDEEDSSAGVPEGEAALPDSYDLAIEAMRNGNAKSAVEILAAEVGRQSSGRARFRRKQQLAELCMKAGESAVAQPILEELVAEIDEHRLEGWEAS